MKPTNIIIWLSGIMILVVGGVYLFRVSEERNKEAKYQECISKAEDFKDFSYKSFMEGKLNVDEGAGSLMAINLFERNYKKDIDECKRKFYK